MNDSGSRGESDRVPEQDPSERNAFPLGTSRDTGSRASDRAAQAELYAALAKAQGAFPKIAKNRAVKIQMKSGGSYNFRYADLEAIMTAIKKPMADNGLSLVQTMEVLQAGALLVTQLLHAGGGRLISETLLPRAGDNDPKAFGAIVTYYRRYAASAITGVSADDDLDENAEQIEEGEAAELKAALQAARAAAAGGTAAYKKFWEEAPGGQRKLLTSFHDGLKKQAKEADKAKPETGNAAPDASAEAGSAS